MADTDAVVIGSGVNSLACAALLARAGWRVTVLERNDWLGGAIYTTELTEPGFKHDVFSAWHPLWVGGAAHAELGDELTKHGLEYLNTELPTATAFPDGSAAFLLRTAEANTQELGPEWPGALERFTPNADLAFGDQAAASAYGQQFASAGWRLTFKPTNLHTGSHTLFVYAHSVVTGKEDFTAPCLLRDSIRHSVFNTGFKIRDVKNPALS